MEAQVEAPKKVQQAEMDFSLPRITANINHLELRTSKSNVMWRGRGNKPTTPCPYWTRNGRKLPLCYLRRKACDLAEMHISSDSERKHSNSITTRILEAAALPDLHKSSQD
ncbi:hypothetical protein ANANG_G00123980 [Anguilla anguilla]|uniref:Uncharacterized protein n=1 Tax=Anguilla anguilla TaxID=7936 RepID=A0A9D3MGR3_ANGAN|nr:hypothetical protein ANANG_G00123980 [Anguilla anguilla]